MPESLPEQKGQIIKHNYEELAPLRRQANPGAIVMRAAEVQPPVNYETAARQIALMQNPHYDLPASIILGRD